MTADRLEQIDARLAEVDSWGRTRWHADSCTYARSDAQFGCDCMRADLEHAMGAIAELLLVVGAMPRCESRHTETRGRQRSWRCDLTMAHAGDHKSTSGHRRWQ